MNKSFESYVREVIVKEFNTEILLHIKQLQTLLNEKERIECLLDCFHRISEYGID